MTYSFLTPHEHAGRAHHMALAWLHMCICITSINGFPHAGMGRCSVLGDDARPLYSIHCHGAATFRYVGPVVCYSML
ncbi:hypothetical protein F4803DRAFT_497385 [Xylaria telfairii]|nr:hypothetical protein F4803DRAFT_497385 [Xylaria telfairii]